MLDIAYIRHNRELLERTAEQKGIDLSVAELLQLDEERRRLLRDVDGLRSERNRLTAAFGAGRRDGEHRRQEQIGAQARDNGHARTDRRDDTPEQQIHAQVRDNGYARTDRRDDTSEQQIHAQARDKGHARTDRRDDTSEQQIRAQVRDNGHARTGRRDDTSEQQIRARVRDIGLALKRSEAELAATERRYGELMERMPNPISADTPAGRSAADNVEVARWGEPPAADATPFDHVELGERLDILDLPRGVKIAGARHYTLKGAGFRLHRAVQQLALDVLEARGFTPLEVPTLVRGEALRQTGFFPQGREQVFAVDGEDRFLTGTSEVGLVAYCGGEVLDVSEPIRLAAATVCFRSEIGSTGRDVRGLYRVHQFAKVEQVILCRADPAESDRLLRELTATAEHILRLLELPYRVVAVCAGDMSPKTHKQFDIETWMPSRGAYGETHSASNLLDFQARRANIRYRDEEGRLRCCHTLNNTAVATPRILIPLLENHQLPDGSVRLPEALRPYMNGMEALRPPN